jgi:hypothetical protein
MRVLKNPGARAGRVKSRYIHTSMLQPILLDCKRMFLSLDIMPLSRPGIDGMMSRLAMA